MKKFIAVFYVNHSETNNMLSNVGINIKSSTRRMKFDTKKGRNNSVADKVANKVFNIKVDIC